ncbi:MDR family MFS transporter [Jiulongibacter sp. NS-SX5]|uniref:MDR family MFS transporter n=1 Tax=Jiulongibacter sp. NS-SX5 TaxID=3463854 RepID=UPI0040586D26
MKKFFNDNYIDAFRGLSREVWILALVSLINRAGTMVVPFLSKYLKEDQGFSYNEVGWIMASFGLGSFAGAWLGGRLSDRIGYYKVMVGALMGSGLIFFAVQQLNGFFSLCLGIFILMTIADAFRPALFVSLNVFSKPENRTRSLTLIRLAINLGFVVGPSAAGFLIAFKGYDALFWIDGLTCILAAVILLKLVRPKVKTIEKKVKAKILSFEAQVYKDKIYWLFLLVCFIISMVFFQIFTTLPLYHKEQFNLSEQHTGFLFFLNGFLIVLFEMPLIHWLQKKGVGDLKLVSYSIILLFLSYAVLFSQVWSGILVVSMLFITFSEMIGFPFANAFAMNRASKGNEGRYMALYTMAFGLAHVVSPKLGMYLIAEYGYLVNFIILALLSGVAYLLTLVLLKSIEKTVV